MAGRAFFLALGLTFSFARAGRAQNLEPVSVERGSGAEECPDASSLAASVARIRGRSALPPSSAYSVAFSYAADTFTAVIHSANNAESQRVLEGRGPSCTALAQATAVTLALLFDSEAEGAPEPQEPEPKVEPAPLPTKPSSNEPIFLAPRDRAPRMNATLSLGGAGLVAVLRPLTPAFTGELGLHVGVWRMSLGVLWSPPQSLALTPGTIRESLTSGTARTCFSLVRREGLRFDACSGLFAGVVTARATGFTQNERVVRPWLALPLELSLADLSGSVGWEVSAAALGALEHQNFSIDHLGPAYESPRVSGMLTLRAVGLLPL